jgi:hypothetical protein
MKPNFRIGGGLGIPSRAKTVRRPVGAGRRELRQGRKLVSDHATQWRLRGRHRQDCESACTIDPCRERYNPLTSHAFLGNTVGHDWTPTKFSEIQQFGFCSSCFRVRSGWGPSWTPIHTQGGLRQAAGAYTVLISEIPLGVACREYGDAYLDLLPKNRKRLIGPPLSTGTSLHARPWSEVV